MADEEIDDNTTEDTTDDSAPEQEPSDLDPRIAAIAKQQAMNNSPTKVNPLAAIQQAQDTAGKQHQYANLLRGFQQILQGASRNNYKANDSVANSMDQQANTGVNNAISTEKLKQAADLHRSQMDKFQIDAAKSKINLEDATAAADPTSDFSKLAQHRFMQIMQQNGQPVNEEQIRGLSATQLAKLSPDLQKDAVTILKQRMLDKEINSREKIANIGANAKITVSNQNNETKEGIAETKGEQKTSDTDNKDALKLNETLDKGWAARGGQAGAVQNKLNSAESAEAVLKQGRTQDGGLDSRQIEELAESVNKLVAGNNSASARVEALIPHTLLGRTQTLKEFLTNHPSGQEMQEFTNRLGETITREKEVANTQKRQFQIESLAAHDRFRKNNPDLYNKILRSKGISPDMIDENGRYKLASTQSNTNTTRMVDPQGNIRLIPNDQVDAAKAAGGQEAP